MARAWRINLFPEQVEAISVKANRERFFDFLTGGNAMNISKRNADFPQFDATASALVDDFNGMARLLVATGNQLVELQGELMNLAVSEFTFGYGQMLTIRPDVPALMQGPLYAQARVRRNIEVARAGLELATRTQGAMLEAVRECLPRRSLAPSYAAYEKPSPPPETPPSGERRTKSTVVNFPDRRRSA